MSSNAVATVPAPSGNVPNLASAASAHTTESANHRGPVQFLKFSKGDYALGKEAIEFEGNRFQFVPAMDLWQKGFQCWKNGLPVDQFWVQYGQPLPRRSELEDHGPYTNQNDGWQESIKFPLVILPGVGGHDTAFTNCEFAASSTGGKNACYALSREYAQWIKEGKVTEDAPFIVVEASADSYRHQTYGKVHFPAFKIVRAISVAEVEQIVNGAAPKAATPDTVPGQESKKSGQTRAARRKADDDTPPFDL